MRSASWQEHSELASRRTVVLPWALHGRATRLHDRLRIAKSGSGEPGFWWRCFRIENGILQSLSLLCRSCQLSPFAPAAGPVPLVIKADRCIVFGLTRGAHVPAHAEWQSWWSPPATAVGCSERTASMQYRTGQGRRRARNRIIGDMAGLTLLVYGRDIAIVPIRVSTAGRGSVMRDAPRQPDGLIKCCVHVSVSRATGGGVVWRVLSGCEAFSQLCRVLRPLR